MSTTVDSAARALAASDPAAETRRTWLVAAATIAAGLCALIVIFRDAAVGAVDVWLTSATYNHCFLIVPIVGYLVWERKDIFANARPTPFALLPALAVVIGGAAWLVANTASVLEIQQFALFGMIEMLLLSVLGWRVFGALLFPMAYLVFLVPTGEHFVPALQDFTTRFIEIGLNLIGIPNYIDGVFITIPSGNFHVAEACAGLRFLIASVAYGVLFASLIYSDWKRRTIFIVLSFVVPVIANGFRALGIVLIAYYSDHKYAVGVDHLVYGWGFFAAITLFLTWLGLRFRDAPDVWRVPGWARPPAGEPAASSASLAIAGAIIVAVAAVAPAYAAYLDSAVIKGPTEALAAPALRAPWAAREENGRWRPIFERPAAEKQFRFEAGRDRAVDLHVVYYADQRKGSELISFNNQLQDDKTWRRLSDGANRLRIDGQEIDVNLRRLAQGSTRRFVWFWYWVDGRFVSSVIDVKLAQVAAKLVSGRRASAAIMLSIEADSEANALATAKDFLAASGPIAPQLARVAASSR
ncbi:MAG: exosortase A [Alphaproteobacteria bacterium]|nr:exosortase A [Alphaproteobacteria bacterium]